MAAGLGQLPQAFGDDPELWDAAAEAVREVAMITADKLPNPPIGVETRLVVSASIVADWRAKWLRALAVTGPAEMISAHANVLDTAGSAFSIATLGSGEKGITEAQFTGSLDDALKDRLDAARKLQKLGC